MIMSTDSVIVIALQLESRWMNDKSIVELLYWVEEQAFGLGGRNIGPSDAFPRKITLCIEGDP